MPIIYVSTGAWGAGQGAPLTAAQHDGNIYDLTSRLALLEALDLTSGKVEDITSAGNVVTFHMSDDTTIDVAFELPSFRHRGAWTNSTAYAVGDIVTQSGSGVYLVAIAHTTDPAPATFNPETTDVSTAGDGSDLIYRLLLPEPDLAQVLRWRGAFSASMALEEYDVFSHPTYGVFVANADHTAADEFDPDRLDDDDAALYAQLAPPPYAPVADTITDTLKSVTRADAGQYFRCTSSETVTIFFDADDFDVGMEFHFEQAGDGSLVFIGDTATEIVPQRDGYDHTTPFKGAVVTAKVVADATIKLIGPHGSLLTA